MPDFTGEVHAVYTAKTKMLFNTITLLSQLRLLKDIKDKHAAVYVSDY